MKEEKEKKKKEPEIESKHKSVSNIIWAVKNLWKLDKQYVLFVIPGIPLNIIFSLAAAYLPKLVIDLLEKNVSFDVMVLDITVYLVASMTITIGINFCEAQLWGRRYSCSNRYQQLTFRKSAESDYELTETQKYQKLNGYSCGDLCQGNSATEFIWMDLQKFLIQVFGIITLASLMVVLNPIIFGVIILVSTFSYFLTRWESKYEEKNKDKWEKEARKGLYLENISDNFPKAKDIKLYGMQSWISNMMMDYQRHIRMWRNRCALRGFWASVLSAILTLVQDGTAYIILTGMLFAGDIQVGDFVFFFGIIGNIASYLSGIMNGMAELIKRGVKIGYTRDLLELENAFNHGKGCALPQGVELPVKIEFRDVWFRYEGAEDDTLKGVNLTIQQGEKLALVGINGAGKTTLVKLMCGFYHPTKGEILVAGKKIDEYNIDEYYSLISAVFQDIDIPAMTICQFVGITDFEKGIDRTRVTSALVKSGLSNRIEELSAGIDTYLRKGIYPDAIDLSGGETQKMMLARAIYKDGPILILDEPTAALDPIAENELYLEYSNLTKGKSAIYISHRFASTRFCDRVALLEDGVITELGSHDELMAQNGRYAYMFNVQSKYYKEGSVNE